MWELLIANHLDQSLLGSATDQKKEEASSSQSVNSQVVFITLFPTRCYSFAELCAFYEGVMSNKVCTYAGAKLFS
jgi:hypothetical protein